MDSFIQEGYDAAQTFVVRGAALQFPLRVLWKYPCESLADWEPAPVTKYSKKKTREGPLLLSPRLPFVDRGRVVFTDGGIYGGATGGPDAPATIHCVEAATGKRLWSRLHDLPGLLEIEGVVAGSMIVHRWWDEKPSLRAFSLEDAREVWSLTDRTLSSNLVVSGQDLLAVISKAQQEQRELMQIDGRSGAMRWRMPIPGENFAIAADQDSVYAAELDGGGMTMTVGRYSLADGSQIWKTDLDGRVAPLDGTVTPLAAIERSLPRVERLGVAGSRLLISFASTALACLDAASGRLVWVFADLQIGSLVSTVLMESGISTTSSLGQGEHTYCRIDPRTGEAILKRMLPFAKDSALPRACALRDVLVLPRGELCALAAATGDVLWQSEVGMRFRTEDGEEAYDSFSAPRIAGGRVFAGRGSDCCLYCFG